MLIDAGRVGRREYRPFTIHLKDRAVGDGNTDVQPIEVRCTPGARRTGVAVVATLENEDRVLYQEEIEHRTNISGRLEERKAVPAQSPLREVVPSTPVQQPTPSRRLAASYR